VRFEESQKRVMAMGGQDNSLDLGYRYLYDVVMDSPDGAVVEIGVLGGVAAATLCAAAEEKNVKYYGIDPWDMLTSNDHLRHLVGDPVKNEELAKKTMSELKFTNYEFIKGFSYDVAKNFNESIGCLFIDGCHCYECVKKDFLLWQSKIALNGTIVFHDAGWDGVGKVIEGIVKNDHNFVEIQNVQIETYKKIS